MLLVLAVRVEPPPPRRPPSPVEQPPPLPYPAANALSSRHKFSRQSRPNIFDLEIRRPELLYKAVVEVDERVVLEKNGEGGWEEGEDGQEDGEKTAPATVVQGLTGEGVRVVKVPDLDAVRKSLQAVLDQGITSLAVVFLHRYYL